MPRRAALLDLFPAAGAIAARQIPVQKFAAMRTPVKDNTKQDIADKDRRSRDHEGDQLRDRSGDEHGGSGCVHRPENNKRFSWSHGLFLKAVLEGDGAVEYEVVGR